MSDEQSKFFGENFDAWRDATVDVERIEFGNAEDMDNSAQLSVLPSLYPTPFPVEFEQMEGIGVSGQYVQQTFDVDGHLTEIVVTAGSAPAGSVGRLVGVQYRTDLGEGWCDETNFADSELVRTWERAMDQIEAAWLAHLETLATWLDEHPEPSVDNEAVAAQILAAVSGLEALWEEWRKVRRFKFRGGRK